MRFRTTLLPVAAAFALAACAENAPLAPASPAGAALPIAALSSGNRLATVEWEGTTPTLYIQSVDGSDRTRVHFDHVHGHVAGNYSSRQMPVTDDGIVAIQRAKWSPNGRQLAVMLLPTYGASQIVVVSADGRDIRTVSPNSQVLYGDIEWSADSRQIAYVVATGPFGRWPDLFVTELGPDRVRRVTTSGQMSAFDTYRFDPSGEVLHFTERLGWAPDGINGLSRLGTADLATGAVSYGASVVGEPQGFARDGTWALFIRTDTGKGAAQQLIRMALPSATETVLTTGALWNAVMLEGEREALVVAPDPNDPNSSSLTFSLLGLETPDDFHGMLNTPKGAAWAALLP